MSHRDRDRDRHDRGRRWRDWDDWRYFGLPYYNALSLYNPLNSRIRTQFVLPAQPAFYTSAQAALNASPQTIQQVILPATAAVPASSGIAGVYRVVAPMGLNLRPSPDMYNIPSAVLRAGTEVQIVGPANVPGWVRTADGRYLCMNCTEGPGGPWLVRLDPNVPFALANPSSNATFFGQDPVATAPVGVLMDLGFRTRKIGGHKKRTVIARPDVAIFQPLALFIPHDTAKHFDIREIRIGHTSFLASRHGVPAERYECNGGVAIQLPPLLAGQPAFLKVENRSGSSHKFRASFTGLAV